MADASESVCRVCGAGEGQRFETYGFAWLRCAGCESVTKILTPAQYDALNPSYDPGAFLRSRSRDEVLSFLDIDDKTKLLDLTLSHWWHGDRSKADFLDVGCGMGGYLFAAKKLGLSVLGFEPSAEHSEVAREILELPVITDYFTPAQADGRRFDLIMLSHVIEHIYDPASFIKGLLSVLKPGGVLLITTPNTQSYIARLCGARWPMLRPVDHVTLLSSRAYAHFALPNSVSVHHRWSEFPFEFGATLSSAARDWLRNRGKPGIPNNQGTAPSAETGVKQAERRLPILLWALTALSFPAHVLARLTGRQACLVTTLVLER